MKVIITSGGTISRIDDVRNIGNFSKGTTGSLIAEEFLRAGATVFYIHSKQAKKPFRSNLSINPSKPLNREINKIKNNFKEFNKYKRNLHEYSIETFEEYYNTTKKLLTEKPIDVIILTAAVSDYGVKKQEGKISSDKDSLTLKLEKNPKVISLIKKWNPKVFQIGFKLLSNTSIEKLVDTAYRNGIKNHSNLTIANLIGPGNFKKRNAFLITPEKSISPVSISKLPERLVEVVTQRLSKRYYHTKLKISDNFFIDFKKQIKEFKKYVKDFYELNLFEPYLKNSNHHFGFVAMRLSKGFLITARGSNKEKLTNEDIVYIPEIDFNKREISIQSKGKKASLNANVAAKIFGKMPEINLILHSHISLGNANQTKVDYPPGTQEDIEEVMRHLEEEEDIVELKNHGIIILGKTHEDINKKISISPAYTKFSKFYDLIYARFQKSSDFLDLVQKFSKKNEKLLDLAGGTGDLSEQLIKNGYKNIFLADKSKKMLNVAKKKLNNIKTYITTIEEFDIQKKFNVIMIRQAINYLMGYADLVKGFKNIKNNLMKNGRLIFNSPNFSNEKKYKDKIHRYDSMEFSISIEEKNIIEDRLITHTQRATLIKKDGKEFQKIYDINKFSLFTKEEFQKALKEAGFKQINFFGKGLSKYSKESKSLYCVAK